MENRIFDLLSENQKLKQERVSNLLLADFLSTLLKNSDMEYVSTFIVEHIGKLLSAKRVTFIRKESKQDWFALYEKQEKVIKKKMLSRGALGKDAFFMYCEKMYFFRGSSPFVAVPIKFNKENIGGLLIEEFDEESLSGIKILDVYAHICGLVIKNTILLEKNTKERETIVAQNDKFNHELKLAQKIHNGILHRGNIKYDQFLFYKDHLPSSYLGGDFYDVIPFDETKIVFYMADIAGHGVGASLLTVFLKESIRSIVEGYIDDEKKLTPNNILRDIQTRFMKVDIQEGTYIGLFMAILDTRKSILHVANAGHNVEPIHIKSDENKVYTYTIKGFPINTWFGSVLDIEYDSKEIQIGENDQFIIITDGATEQKNKENEQMGIERVKTIFNENRENDMDEQFQIMLDQIKKFSNQEKFEDDIAFIGLKKMQD